jgi:hypothetical protein
VLEKLDFHEIPISGAPQLAPDSDAR